MLMINYLYRFLSFGSLCLLLVSCSSTGDSGSTSGDTGAYAKPSSRERAIANRLFSLVNEERAKVGKKALRGESSLNKMAQKHSQFQATSKHTKGKASHFGTENRAQYAYLKHGIENLGEVVQIVSSSDPDPALSAVNAWRRSKEHNRHMTGSWELTGIGVHMASNGKTYITMLVGIRPGGVPRSMQPRAWR